MKLNLKRPIVFFDLETTGVDTAKDRIVEISMVKVMPDGEQIVKTRKLNPGMHIPAEATAIHGITDEDVRDCPTFAQVAKSLEQFIRGCDFGGFNSNRFDLPVLVEEFLRAGVDVDFKRRNSSTCRTSSTRRNSARWWRPINSIATRIWRTPIRPRPIRWRPTKCSWRSWNVPRPGERHRQTGRVLDPR